MVSLGGRWPGGKKRKGDNHPLCSQPLHFLLQLAQDVKVGPVLLGILL